VATAYDDYRGASCILHGSVDRARAQLLSEAHQGAITALVDVATESWLERQPPSDDPEQRHRYREFCRLNIEARVLAGLFNPVVGLDKPGAKLGDWLPRPDRHV